MSTMESQTVVNRITQKRLVGEMIDLNKNRLHYCQAVQDKTDPFLFYFLLRGEDDSQYKGGYYLGKITLPSEYPRKPGDFYMLTPNGRFLVDRKICLTNSGYHLESWNALWSIRNMIIGFYSIFIADDTTGLSHIKETPSQRKEKANASINFNKKNYPEIFNTQFDQFFKEDGTMRTDKKEIEEYIKELEKKRKDEKKKKKDDKKKIKKVKKVTQC